MRYAVLAVVVIGLVLYALSDDAGAAHACGQIHSKDQCFYAMNR